MGESAICSGLPCDEILPSAFYIFSLGYMERNRVTVLLTGACKVFLSLLDNLNISMGKLPGGTSTHARSSGHRLCNLRGICTRVWFHPHWKVNIWNFLGRAKLHIQGWLYREIVEVFALVE
jgi:hypothetical protein